MIIFTCFTYKANNKVRHLQQQIAKNEDISYIAECELQHEALRLGEVVPAL